MKSAKLYLLGMTMSALSAILPSCGGSEENLEITPKNYIIHELSMTEVDSFKIKQSNRSSEEKQHDTLETIIKLKGYVNGVTSNGANLDFLLDNGQGLGKFCRFYGQSGISSLLEASMDMGRVTVKPELITVYGVLDDDSKLLTVKRIDYEGKTFDWTQNIDIAKLFENSVYDPSARKTTIDSLTHADSIQNMMNVKIEGYIMGKSTSADLAFILSDAHGNTLSCYKAYTNPGNTSNSDVYLKFSQLKTIVDALNQKPTKVEVTGNFSKTNDGLLILESMTSSNSISNETKTITFPSNAPNNTTDYVYVSAKEAKELKDYQKVKIIGDVAGVSASPIILALIKDYDGETVFCRKAEINEYSQKGVVMLNYTKNMLGKQELVNDKQMYKYIEISGRLQGGVINIEEIKDVWSESPIRSKDDMNRVLYRNNLDHRVNFND